MAFTMTYPRSRIKSSGQCNMCSGTMGNFIDRGVIVLSNEDGTVTKLLRLSCDYCGYTLFFDPTVITEAAYLGSELEELPESLA